MPYEVTGTVSHDQRFFINHYFLCAILVMSKSKHQEVSVPGVEVEGPDAHGGHVGVVLLPDVKVDLH